MSSSTSPGVPIFLQALPYPSKAREAQLDVPAGLRGSLRPGSGTSTLPQC